MVAEFVYVDHIHSSYAAKYIFGYTDSKQIGFQYNV